MVSSPAAVTVTGSALTFEAEMISLMYLEIELLSYLVFMLGVILAGIIVYWVVRALYNASLKHVG